MSSTLGRLGMNEAGLYFFYPQGFRKIDLIVLKSLKEDEDHRFRIFILRCSSSYINLDLEVFPVALALAGLTAIRFNLYL